jgi:class 3 adenylate cyclase
VQGGETEKAIDYCTRAGERATQLLAYEEAAEHYERALQVLEFDEPPDGARQFELLLALGSTERRFAERTRTLATLERAVEAARGLDDPTCLVRAAIELLEARFELLVTNPDSVALLEESLSLLAAEDSALRARVMGLLSLELSQTVPRPARAPELGEEAMAMARRVGHPLTIAGLLMGQYVARSSPEDARDRVEIASEILALGERTGDRAWCLNGLTWRSLALLELGDAAGADRDLEAAGQLGEELRQPWFLWHHTTLNAMRALLEGRFEEGETLAQEALSIGQRVEIPSALQVYGVQISRVRGEQGRLDELEGMIKGFVEQFPTQPGWRSRLATIYAELGKQEEARHHYEILAREEFADIPRDIGWLLTLAYCAQVCRFLGDVRRAPILYELISPCASLNFITANAACNGPAARPLALLAWTLSRWDDAERHFDEALAMNVRIGARPHEARTQLDYAEMLLERSRSGDRDKALALANRALDTARELGMKVVMEKALAMKLRAQGMPSESVASSIEMVTSSIGERCPDLAPHAAPDGTVTLMFSDMEGFTEMTERLGDLRAREVIREHNAIVRKQLQAHGGYEVELQGDGFLLAFGSARRALACAVAIQRAFDAYDEQPPDEPIRVRIGLHTGEVLKDADKFFGKTVILTSRIAAQAQGGEILVSALLKGLVESAGDVRFGAAHEVDLKGISERQRVFAVEWE